MSLPNNMDPGIEPVNRIDMMLYTVKGMLYQ